MGVEKIVPVCEGLLEKKIDHRRFPIGSAWKSKYCVLNSEALRLYRSKVKMVNGCSALRTVPLCHIKSVARVDEDKETQITYFNVLTEQGETLAFRCKDKVGWVAQIQIQLIHYKNRQDILRYKQNSFHQLPVPVRTLQQNNNEETNRTSDKTTRPSREFKTVVLPNYRNSGIGIGITVIPLPDGRVVVNRLLNGGPAMRLGNIEPRDQIVSVNGLRVSSVEMLSEVVQNSPKSVTLVIKPRSSKSSPVMEDPKRILSRRENYLPDYINMAPYTNAKRIFEKGCTE